MKKLNAGQAFAIENRKGGGVGGGVIVSPPRTLAKLRYLFTLGTHIPNNEMIYAFSAI